jgi:hypothetical protein
MYDRDVRVRNGEYDRSGQSLQERRARRELERLALIVRNDNESDRDSELGGYWRGETLSGSGASSPRRGGRTAQVALLVGAAMIAALAVLFG